MQQPLPGPPKAGVGFLISLMKSSSNYSSVQENESKEEGSTPTPPPPRPHKWWLQWAAICGVGLQLRGLSPGGHLSWPACLRKLKWKKACLPVNADANGHSLRKWSFASVQTKSPPPPPPPKIIFLKTGIVISNSVVISWLHFLILKHGVRLSVISWLVVSKGAHQIKSHY